MRVTSFLAAVILLTGCAQVITGSPTYQTIELSSASNGVSPDAPSPTLPIMNTDSGAIDGIAATAMEDIYTYWGSVSPLPGGAGDFVPLKTLVSFDSKDRENAFTVCGQHTYKRVNALFCPSMSLIMWDRGVLLPALRTVAGDLAIAHVLSHEVGHQVQRTVTRVSLPTIVAEAQADCYAGTYLRWVADGNSERFNISADGAGEVLRTIALVGDSPHIAGEKVPVHGTSVERIWYTHQGFTRGADHCATINFRTIEANRAGMPTSLRGTEVENEGNAVFTDEFVQHLVDTIATSLGSREPVQLSDEDCRVHSNPVAWCPNTGTVYATAQNLNRHVYEMTGGSVVGRVGDGTAIGGLINAVSQPWIEDHGATVVVGRQAGYRSACVVGAVVRVMADPGYPHKVIFSAGDADEILTDLLYDGFSAMDASGAVSSGIYNRTAAYLTGMYVARAPYDCLSLYA